MTTEIHSTDIDPSDPAASPPIRVRRIVRPNMSNVVGETAIAPPIAVR
jgi:hypothetical protein